MLRLMLPFVFVASSVMADDLVLLSTTSTVNSGLLDDLLPQFNEATGINVKVIAMGTGQALRAGADGDGDVLLVHSPEAEIAFVEAGQGIMRRDVMYNDFVIVGPATDPAAISGEKDVLVAFSEIAQQKVPFVSRGDDSGTHRAEINLWLQLDSADRDKQASWYRETGSGAGESLNVAVQMDAYTMTDRATWLSYANKRGFEILVEGDARLFNQYGVIIVNPNIRGYDAVSEAELFVDWLTSSAGQSAIAAYRIDDQQLFFPNAQK